MRPEKIGRIGEDLVAKYLGYRRQPASGAVWPYKEDLVRPRSMDGLISGIDELAQVKTTTGQVFFKDWMTLAARARVENAEPRWYHVVLAPDGAFIFETILVRHVLLGPNAIGTRREKKDADQGGSKVGRERRAGRGAPVRGRIRLQGRAGKPTTYRRRARIV